jgi:hypothetical protein
MSRILVGPLGHHLLGALVVGVALLQTACGDGKGVTPVPLPQELQILSGDGQQALRGDVAIDPLRVRALSADGQPAPDAAVHWTATDGEAILDPAQSPTDANGEAESRFTAGPTLGEILVSARTEGAPPATFTITTLDPCQWTKRGQLMTPIAGVLGPLDCVDEGLFWDLYSFSITTPQAVTIATSSNAFDTRSWLLTSNGIRLLGRAGTIDSLASQHRAVTKAILASGDYWAGASSYRPGTSGSYLFQLSTTSPQAESCEEEVWVVRGITTDQALSSTDCVDVSGRFHYDAFSLILWAGEGLTLTQTSSDFRPSLRLIRRSGEAIARVDGSKSGIATIEFTADLTRGEYSIIASSVGAQESGAYTLTVSETAAAVVDEVSEPGRISSPGDVPGLKRTPLAGPLFDWKH